MSSSEQPSIAIISTAVFLYTSKLLGSSKFQLCLCSLNIQADFAQLVETSNLSNISSKYHKFANVLSKAKAEFITPHYPYDLKINLEEGAQSSVDLIYSLLASKQDALKK